MAHVSIAMSATMSNAMAPGVWRGIRPDARHKSRLNTTTIVIAE